MTHRRISRESLANRIDTLRRRHAEIDTRIAAEQQRPMPDMARLKQLKTEKLGLKDAIAITRTILARHGPQATRVG